MISLYIILTLLLSISIIINGDNLDDHNNPDEEEKQLVESVNMYKNKLIYIIIINSY